MNRCLEAQAPMLADRQIIDLYWERDEGAIRETHRKYGRFLLRIADNILHDKPDSEECRNDTYLGIWNAIPPARPDVFPAFITKIMRNIARDKYRKRKSKKRIPSEMLVALEELEGVLHDGSAPDAVCEAEELGRLINGFLSGLTAQQRNLFIGRFYFGDTLAVVSEKLHISVPKAHRELEKIKRSLKAYLERNGVYV